MPKQKLTIVPVTLHTEIENTSVKNPAVPSSNPYLRFRYYASNTFYFVFFCMSKLPRFFAPEPATVYLLHLKTIILFDEIVTAN